MDMLENNSSEFTKHMLPLIEMLPPEQIEQVPDGVFVAHLLPRHIPKNVFEKRCKIVNIYRNPKDVVVSFKFIQKKQQQQKKNN